MNLKSTYLLYSLLYIQLIVTWYYGKNVLNGYFYNSIEINKFHKSVDYTMCNVHRYIISYYNKIKLILDIKIS